MSAAGARLAALDALRAPIDALPDPVCMPWPADVAASGRRVVTIIPPGSKSMTNRALLLAALARGESEIRGALTDADDAMVMIDALRTLGAGIEIAGTGVRVRGVCGRWPNQNEARLDLHNAGTATRFLAAAALVASGPVVIDGDARMRERPIGELADALAALGARVEWLGSRGCPPLRITPPPPSALAQGAPMRAATLPTTSSGQFVSALLLVAPCLPGGLRVRIDGAATSPAYIEMTLRMLDRIGARAEWAPGHRDMRVFAPEGGAPPGFTLDIEPDATGATYFWGGAALLPGVRCMTPGIGAAGLQGDARFAGALARMGAAVEQDAHATGVTGASVSLRAIDADCADMPDAALTLAALACFADGPSTLRGLRTLRVKETDRLAALQTELRKLGAGVEIIGAEHDPALRITPAGAAAPRGHESPRLEFETYNDHRMAMALALVSLRRPNVWLRNPACVRKTYPGFWADFARLAGGGTSATTAG